MKNERAKSSTPESLIFTGEEHEITLPSGKVVTIRESNGEDDGILSKVKDASDNTNILNYLSSIIVEDHDLKTKPKPSDILDWLSNDKWYLLLKQRIINLGPEFVVINTCGNPKCKTKTEYVEDLSEMDGDLSQKDYKAKGIQVYPYAYGQKKTLEYTTSRKNAFQFDLLTGLLERKLNDVPDSDRDLNQVLLARNIKLFSGGKWIPLFDFRRFPSKEMNELRGYVIKQDKVFEPRVTFECPKCNLQQEAIIFNINVFFYPGAEI